VKNLKVSPDVRPNNRPKIRKDILDRICNRVHYLTTQMIYLANHRDDKEKGDPKVGGHPAACASSLHITGALHLIAKTGFDFVANKPHAAPVDHSYNYILDLLFKNAAINGGSTDPGTLEKLSLDEANTAMHGLRHFPLKGEAVFQSYHSAYDPDHHGFLPSGTVGIPPVNCGYLAHAYTFLRDHNYDVPDAHFWAIMGDSEFREGSVYEAVPDFAEREIGNLTWIVDYNRQSLDGHRITNKEIVGGTDDQRIERTMAANGWEVINLRHGQRRLDLFKKPDGEIFRNFLENDLQDYELQALLLVKDMGALKKGLEKAQPKLKKFLASVSNDELFLGFRDFGGHDILMLADAMEKSKQSKRKPTIIIAHTLKGWGLRNAAAPGNHSSLPSEDEVEALRQKEGIKGETLFARLDPKTEEGQFCLERGAELLSDMKAHYASRDKNKKLFAQKLADGGEIPVSMGINLKMASYPHTQWMLGQLTAKLTRIANQTLEAKGDAKALPAEEHVWRTPAELLVTMAPDVGTSTNLNPAMDGKIFGAPIVTDWETDLGVKDKKTPDLVMAEGVSNRFLRFEIAEGNVMSCVGSYGKMRDFTGVPVIPLMTVYDFFVKRAHDQFFYNLYWKSAFILIGTPAGVSLSPEGAQHGWKSDFQIPNQITWEPFFCQELDWIMCESIRRHMNADDEGRSGVFIRGVTRGVEQKMFAQYLKRQLRFKSDSGASIHAAGFAVEGAVDESTVENISEEEMFETIRQDVLAGAYYLADYRGYAGYEPGDNVVNIFALGTMGTEALKASDELLNRGIYANVIMVSSTDLLCGIQAHNDDYALLRERLGVNGGLVLQPLANGQATAAELMTLSGRRVPCVSVHDGESGLLDNLGSILGVRHEALAVRKHSRCGRPKDVYAYHHIDAASVVEACGKVLAETALETVRVSPKVIAQIAGAQPTAAGFQNWRDLWPPQDPNEHH
jgi:pyruvate dehydrogenase E1 component